MLARMQEKWKLYALFLGMEIISDMDITTGVPSGNYK
jgi:hypothetical protein